MEPVDILTNRIFLQSANSKHLPYETTLRAWHPLLPPTTESKLFVWPDSDRGN